MLGAELLRLPNAIDRKSIKEMHGEPGMADDDGGGYRFPLAQQLFGKMVIVPGHNPQEPKAEDALEAMAHPVVVQHLPVSEASPPNTPHLEASQGEVHHKELKTAAELAEMIEQDLARHPECPKAGFRVTVYGGSHWRAMLTITPAAGGVRNPQEWRDLTNDLAERLRKRYQLTWE
jgi:hypothetical protein